MIPFAPSNRLSGQAFQSSSKTHSDGNGESSAVDQGNGHDLTSSFTERKEKQWPEQRSFNVSFTKQHNHHLSSLLHFVSLFCNMFSEMFWYVSIFFMNLLAIFRVGSHLSSPGVLSASSAAPGHRHSAARRKGPGKRSAGRGGPGTGPGARPRISTTDLWCW